MGRVSPEEDARDGCCGGWETTGSPASQPEPKNTQQPDRGGPHTHTTEPDRPSTGVDAVQAAVQIHSMNKQLPTAKAARRDNTAAHNILHNDYSAPPDSRQSSERVILKQISQTTRQFSHCLLSSISSQSQMPAPEMHAVLVVARFFPPTPTPLAYVLSRARRRRCLNTNTAASDEICGAPNREHTTCCRVPHYVCMHADGRSLCCYQQATVSAATVLRK